MTGFGGRKGQDAGCRASSKKRGERFWAVATCLAMGTGFWALAHTPAVADYYPYPSPDSDQTQINRSSAEFFLGPLVNPQMTHSLWKPYFDPPRVRDEPAPVDWGARINEILEEQRRQEENLRVKRLETIARLSDIRNTTPGFSGAVIRVLLPANVDPETRIAQAENDEEVRELTEELRRIEQRIETLEGQLRAWEENGTVPNLPEFSDSAIPELAPIVVLAFASDASSGGSNGSFFDPSVSLKTVTGNDRTQFRFSSHVSSLSDSSDADREGHVSHLSLRATRQMTPRFALSGGITLRDGSYDIDTVQSSNDYTGFAISASGSYQLDQNITLFGGASVERGNFDTTLGTTTGSYDATSAAVVAGIEGLYGANGLVLQPQATLSYVHYDLEGYTASDGTVVSGQSDGTGSFNAALTVSKPLAGNGGLESWQPYATVRILHNFEDSGPFMLGPGVTFEDGQTFGTLGVGAMFQFDNGGEAGLGVSYTDAFDGDLGALTIGAMLSLPLN